MKLDSGTVGKTDYVVNSTSLIRGGEAVMMLFDALQGDECDQNSLRH